MLRPLTRLLAIVAVCYGALVLALAVFQDVLIYHPHLLSEEAALARAGSVSVKPWRSPLGELLGWHRPIGSKPAANRLVVFHGNTGGALDRTHFIDGFQALEGGAAWEVFLFEYPGFGARRGEIGEEPFTAAGLSAIDSLLSADPRPVYLLGESLGSGLACRIAAESRGPIAGLLLITPYSSLPAVAHHHYPYVPTRYLLRDRWDNVSALRRYRGPLAVRLAGEDEVTPVEQGKHLFGEAMGRKRLWIVPGATHNGLDFSPGAVWWRELSAFLLEGD